MAAMAALRLDSDLGEAHTSMAGVLWLHDWQWQEAQAEFTRSLALNPTYPIANHWYAEYLLTMGRHEETIARMKKSQELDPLSLIISVAVGWAFYMARRYDDAIEQLRRTVELEPNCVWRQSSDECGVGANFRDGAVGEARQSSFSMS
jgi:tetratricopeptide (TPR) repeat protein